MGIENRNIMHLIDTFNEGGAQALICEYAHKMKDKYKIVIVMIYDSEAENVNQLREEVEIDTIYKSRNLITRTFNKLFGIWYIPYKLKKIIKYRKPDVIHAHLLVLQYLKNISKDIRGIKLFYTSHSQPERIFEGKRCNEGKAAQYLIQHNNLKIIALHEEMKKAINTMFGVDNTIVIKNGVDIKYIRNVIVDIANKKKELHIPLDSYIVGHIGRFIELKNHKFLIDIFIEIYKKKSNAFLILIGTGELLDSIKRRINEMEIENRVLILSNRMDIPELLHIMNVFIFPSYLEGLSIALLEAQAAGLRIIVSDKVNEANFLSSCTIPMSLDKSAEEWANIAVDNNILNSEYGNLDDYDINNVVCDLENLYFNAEYK